MSAPRNGARGAMAALRRCFIVDDHPMMREAMAGLVRDIEPGAELVTAGTVAEALEVAATATGFDALIVDLHLPDGDGSTLVAEFRRRWPALPILVLTASEDHGDVRRLIATGATGFAPKSSGYATLSAALRLVLAGQTYVPPLMLDSLSVPAAASPVPVVPDETTEAASAGTRDKLTPRQLEVLRLVCAGLPNKTISRQLGLAERTTKVHIGAIFRTLGVSNRTQAVLAAQAAGLFD